jgi:hypothetical protein
MMVRSAAPFVAVAVAAIAPCLSGCYAHADVAPPHMVYAAGYVPAYYDGYVVYYDDGGRPYYYVNGAVTWIPANSPYYAHYARHWQIYGASYRNWYATSGYRFVAWRHPSYEHHRVVIPPAPPAGRR